MSAIYDFSNPFFRRMPIVAIARATTQRNGETFTTPDTECIRVFVRLDNNRVFPAPLGEPEIMPTGKAMDMLFGFDNLKEFNPEEINAKHDANPRPG
jgi:hypothetical protein